MNRAQIYGLIGEIKLIKEASLAEHALDVGGLAMLAAPTVQKMRNKPMSQKSTNRTELAGLGVLAAHPAYSMAKHLMKRGFVEKQADGRAERIADEAKGRAHAMPDWAREGPKTFRSAKKAVSTGRAAARTLSDAPKSGMLGRLAGLFR